ncbi:ATP-dependent DNA helicase [Alkalibacter rhizosphaerae]|uniref:ATP-dependent DNA helicase n=1 Tax=Alkalibacter rhizosphaerae TaxID=2815577 RepID=A0A974XM10_9FIRM|nr:ATP-dependent DNA helicase [Alkalibacter rhizosphaerae]QSX08416.1 ATP-dependent DNA helicase [Alkalibacter rhizosphaerae]
MIKFSVRQLVERVLRSGDIDGGYVSRDRMLEGAVAHRILQKINKKNVESYESEVTLRCMLHWEDMEFQLEGRADGLFVLDEMIMIDEIKTTILPISKISEDMEPVHWAQAKCYAYMYGVDKDLDRVGVQMTYYNIESKESVQYQKNFSLKELESFMLILLEKYSVWAKLQTEWIDERNHSLKGLPFPFEGYRKGQRELAVAAYKSITHEHKLFSQAPTGTGKTISMLYPAMKALGEGEIEKIFYLTAKTITREAPLEALMNMMGKGLSAKVLVLTAKDKICFCDETLCNPGYCSYARGHYDRVDEALIDGFKQTNVFTRSQVEELAREHHVCPFELSLDLALLVDVVICDYNYVFDPRAYLRRFFAGGRSESVFLIDEAHNLVDRGREMFSAQITKTSFYELKKQWKGKNKEYESILTKINKEMIFLRKGCKEEGFLSQKEIPVDLMHLLTLFVTQCESMLKEDQHLQEDGGFLQQYFDVLGFLGIGDFYDGDFITFVESRGSEVTVKLLCLDPATQLKEACMRGKSSILFSATLSPMGYFKSVLGGEEEDWHMSLESPFTQERLCLMAADNVSTKYHKREDTKGRISDLIQAFIEVRKGNYIVYFPSYRYMESVQEDFVLRYPQTKVVVQKKGLTEEEREEFLELFQEEPQGTFVAFCVLGGIFSEGIDLKGQRLIGAIVVSVGLPQINTQQNLLKDHFEEKYGMGFEFAYMYPGMNKVMQAVGRVIRSESDMGAVLLIDERYGHRNYKRIFPPHWKDSRTVRSAGQLSEDLNEFWQEAENHKKDRLNQN